MKQATAALINLLHSSDKFYMADLYTITLTNGTVLRYTSFDTDLTVGGERYTAFALERNEIRQNLGIEVDELSLEVFSCANETIPGGVTIFQAMCAGAFDNAVLKLERVFSPRPWQCNMAEVPADYVLLLFLGRMDVEEVGGVRATVKVKSLTELLNMKLPRNLYMPNCINSVFDRQCTLNRQNYGVNKSVALQSTTSVILSDFTQAEGYFNMGTITFTSGENTNVYRTIRHSSAGILVLTLPLPSSPVVGDTFIVWPGCDKTKDACKNKFNNLNNFRGFPYIPVPETIL